MIVAKSLPYAQEVGDVGVALAGLVRRIREKKPLTELVSEELPELYAAVDKAGEIGDEIHANRQAALATMGYHSGEIVDALLPPVAPAPAAAAPAAASPVSS